MPIASNQIAQEARPIQSLTTVLEAADILTLDTIPVELVPEPGAGKIILLQQVIAQLSFGTQPFLGPSLIITTDINYGGMNVKPLNVLLSMTEDALSTSGGLLENATLGFTENKPLSVWAAGPTKDTEPFGDGSLILTVFYSIVDLQ